MDRSIDRSIERREGERRQKNRHERLVLFNCTTWLDFYYLRRNTGTKILTGLCFSSLIAISETTAREKWDPCGIQTLNDFLASCVEVSSLLFLRDGEIPCRLRQISLDGPWPSYLLICVSHTSTTQSEHMMLRSANWSVGLSSNLSCRALHVCVCAFVFI